LIFVEADTRARVVNTTTDANVDVETGKSTEKKTNTSRIVTMDYLKGIAAFWFTLGHMMLYFNDGSWNSIMALVIIILDWLTVTLFLTLTVVGTMASINKKELSGKTKGMFTTAVQKSVFLLIVGMVINIVIDNHNPEKLDLWAVFGANMISVIALVQMFTYLLVKMKKWLRFVLLAVLVVLYPILLNACLVAIGFTDPGQLPVSASRLTTPGYIIYYLLFHQDAMAPTFEWLITAVLTSLVFEDFAKSASLSPNMEPVRTDVTRSVPDPHYSATKNLAIIGLLCVACSVLFGGFFLWTGISPSNMLYSWMHEGDQFSFYTAEGLPLFFVRHFPNYTAFNVGVLAVVYAALHHASAFRRKVLILQDTFVIAGQYSFSIFVYGHAFYLMFLKITIWQYIAICIPIAIAMLIAVRIWALKARGVGSLEWLLNMYMKGLAKLQKQDRRAISKQQEI
jgi:hypothetical protein